MSLEDRGTGDAELAAEISELELRQRIAPTERRSRIVQHLTFLRELQAMRAARAPDRGCVRAVVDGAIRGMARYPSGHQVLPNDIIYAIADRVADQLCAPAPKPHHAGRQAIPVINPADTPELREAISKLSNDGKAELFTLGGGGGRVTAGDGQGGEVPEWIARKKDLDAKIPGFTVGTGGGAGMAKSGDPGWQSRVHAAADKIDRGANLEELSSDGKSGSVYTESRPFFATPIEPPEAQEIRDFMDRSGGIAVFLGDSPGVRAARAAAVSATPPDEDHPLGQVSVTRFPIRTPVEVVLARLERSAKAATAGKWESPKEGPGSAYHAVVSDWGDPTDGYGGNLIGESFGPADGAYVVVTQPAEILALIATVRQMIPMVKDWASRRQSEMNQIGWADDGDSQAALERALFVEVP